MKLSTTDLLFTLNGHSTWIIFRASKSNCGIIPIEDHSLTLFQKFLTSSGFRLNSKDTARRQPVINMSIHISSGISLASEPCFHEFEGSFVRGYKSGVLEEKRVGWIHIFLIKWNHISPGNLMVMDNVNHNIDLSSIQINEPQVYLEVWISHPQVHVTLGNM